MQDIADEWGLMGISFYPYIPRLMNGHEWGMNGDEYPHIIHSSPINPHSSSRRMKI